MPQYLSKCDVCGSKHIYMSKIDNRNITPQCCGISTERVIETPQISAMCWQGHKGCMVNGRWIEDGATYNKMMRDGNYISAEEGKQQAAAVQVQRAKDSEKKLDAAISDGMRQVLNK